MLWLKQERKTHSALVKSGKSGNYKISQRYKKNKQCGGSIWICSVAFVVALGKQTKQKEGGKLVVGNKQKKKLLMGKTKKWSPAVA